LIFKKQKTRITPLNLFRSFLTDCPFFVNTPGGEEGLHTHDRTAMRLGTSSKQRRRTDKEEGDLALRTGQQ
jgi:hypothetical protein